MDSDKNDKSSHSEDEGELADESQKLMSDSNNLPIVINGNKNTINFQKVPNDSANQASSLPVVSHGMLEESLSGSGQRYGSVPEQKNTDDGSGKRVIYCVHGKPSGCCATLINGSGSSFSIEVKPRQTDQHCHRERDFSDMDKKARRKLILASVLCLIFMIAEIAGGLLSGSLAIATDAAHLLTDFAAFMISLFAIWVGQRKPTRTMPFGWHRAEVIGALTSVLTIWLVTGILVYMAAMRVVNNDFEIEPTVMLISSGVGVIVNIIMGMTLHQHSHSHSHGQPSADTERVVAPAAAAKNINVSAAFIHVLGDFIQSIGVFIAALIIYFREDWKLVDPICTFLFSVLVLFTTYSILKDTLLVLMEGMPRDVDFNDVLETFLSIDGVVAVHNLRIWALSLGKTALAAHVAIEEKANPNEILTTATRKIHEKYNFFEMTLQIEYYQPKMQNCTQCQVPK
nr:zinc transporter 2-like isoform X2 [Halyomorpha halys]